MKRLAIPVCALALAACLPPPSDVEPQPQPSARLAYHDAAAALEAGEYESASALLTELAVCDATAAGREALLLLISASLDPRNPKRSLTAGMTHAVRLLRLPDAAPEDRALATSYFLVALELGGDASVALPATNSRDGSATAGAAAGSSAATGAPGRSADAAAAAGAETGRADCPRVPDDALLAAPSLRVDIPTVTQRIRALEAQRRELEQRLRTSENNRQALERRLAEVAAELERVRQILRQ